MNERQNRKDTGNIKKVRNKVNQGIREPFQFQKKIFQKNEEIWDIKLLKHTLHGLDPTEVQGSTFSFSK